MTLMEKLIMQYRMTLMKYIYETKPKDEDIYTRNIYKYKYT